MINERAIIERVLAGEADAFGLLVEEYQGPVYNLALRMCGNPEDAYDLAQEAFFRAWRGLSGFQFESAFSTWLFRLSSNVCLDFLRAKKRRPTLSLTTAAEDDDEATQFDIVDPQKSPEEILLAAEERQTLARAMNELPAEYRQILTLRAINDLSYTQISEILQIREGTVKSRLNRARLALRNKILQIGNNFGSETSVHTEGRDIR